ncbi:hypothetical protein BST61_g3167 [Cercospora zeina]
MSSSNNKPTRQNRDTLLSTLPPPYPGDLRPQIKAQITSSTSTLPLLIILDDDPTGTQTCHNIQVLTTWSLPVLRAAFTSPTLRPKPADSSSSPIPALSILTKAAEKLIQAITQNLLVASTENCPNLSRSSGRSDSTLRGHFPLWKPMS